MVFSIIGLDKLKIDDPVGAISVHGTAGIWGVLAVLLSNEEATLQGQLTGLLVIFAFVFITSSIVWAALKLIVGIRVSEKAEHEGIDLAECGMQAYPEFVSARGSTNSAFARPLPKDVDGAAIKLAFARKVVADMRAAHPPTG